MAAATYMSSFDREQYVRQGQFTDAEFDISYANSAIELDEYGLSGLQAKKPLAGMVEEISAWDGVKQVTGMKNLGVVFDFP